MPAVFVFFLLSACEGPVEKQAVRQQEAVRASSTARLSTRLAVNPPKLFYCCNARCS